MMRYQIATWTLLVCWIETRLPDISTARKLDAVYTPPLTLLETILRPSPQAL